MKYGRPSLAAPVAFFFGAGLRFPIYRAVVEARDESEALTAGVIRSGYSLVDSLSQPKIRGQDFRLRVRSVLRCLIRNRNPVMTFCATMYVVPVAVRNLLYYQPVNNPINKPSKTHPVTYQAVLKDKTANAGQF